MTERIRHAYYVPLPADRWGCSIAQYTRICYKALHWHVQLKEIPFVCHVEMQPVLCGDWYSSASRNWDGTNGTRWITEERLLKNRDRWLVYEFDAPRPVSDMIATCEKEKGKPYDWYGIFGFVTITGKINARDKWYCEEIVWLGTFGNWLRRISPCEGLMRVLKECKNVVLISNSKN